jgi:hypothetical protein
MLVSATLFSAFGFLISEETRNRQALFACGLFFAMVGMWAASGVSVSALAACLTEFFIFAQAGLFFGVLRAGNATGYFFKRALRMV